MLAAVQLSIQRDSPTNFSLRILLFSFFLSFSDSRRGEVLIHLEEEEEEKDRKVDIVLRSKLVSFSTILFHSGSEETRAV